MTQRQVIIENQDGIHCRPAAILLDAAKGYPGEIKIRKDSRECRLQSVLDLLSMNLACGVEVTIAVDGPDEEAMADRLAELFARQFDFKR